MKILIKHAVPLNNGEAALIFALGNALKQRNNEVTYSTNFYELTKEKYPEENWVESLLNKKITKIPLIGYIFLLIHTLFDTKIKTYDAIISAPGGYIHSYYRFRRKIQLLVLYKIIKKRKIYLYSQSIGTLSTKDRKFMGRNLKYFDLIYVRDDVSLKRVYKMDKNANVELTKDAAFLINKKEKEMNKNTVAISVREWSFEDRNEEVYIDLIHKIVKFFYDNKFKIVFLSTCQGLTDYRDDSVIARRIYEELPKDIKRAVSVDNDYYNLNQLRERLTEFRFVIGTRLHMCILSWLSNTPAFNISYEEKGIETYKYLGIPQFSVDYNYEGELSTKLKDFIQSDSFDEVYKVIDQIKFENELKIDSLLTDARMEK